MSSEIELALAQVFRKKGKSTLTEKEFVFAASLDLRWFSPKDAQKFLDIGLDSELLSQAGGKIRPTFDYQSMDAPSGYSPSQNLLKASIQPKGIFLKLIDRISTEMDKPKKEAISLVNKTQDKMNVDVEVAALIVARSMGIDISPFLDEIEEGVATHYKMKTD
jgi:hypothetical protein